MQISTTLTALAAGVLGGAIAGYGASRLAQPDPKPAARAESSVVSAGDDSRGLRERLAAVERTVSSLSRQRQAARALSALGAADGTERDGGPPAEVVDDPVFEVAVRDIVERIDSERTSERQARREERRQLMAERWTDRLAQQVLLSEPQKAKVQQIVTSFFDELRKMRESDAGGALAPDERRAAVRAAREQSEKKLAEVLDARQMEKYRALGEEYRMNARGGRGRD